MKFKEGDVIKYTDFEESEPFIIEEIRDGRYFNENGFYIEQPDEDYYEKIGNSEDYDNFITCRDNLYSVIQSMESFVNRLKSIMSLEPFEKEDVKEFKEMYKLALNKIDLFKSRLENIKEDMHKLEK